VEHGAVLLKFWLHIDADEQLRRFKERESIAFKQYKITEEDWRNRERWGEYELAVSDMVMRTSTEIAPWTLVAGPAFALPVLAADELPLGLQIAGYPDHDAEACAIAAWVRDAFLPTGD
jgi:Asp-tRNA(Asn)/Glu-tRNA(Gln) amidotransferase A subunit family amidase